jgi:hypothetical protein
MKAALILIALAGTLTVALGMQQVSIEPEPSRVFTVMDEVAARDAVPGGRMVNANTAYRRCENGAGQRADQGEWTYYERDGRRYTLRQGCWR